MSFRWGGGRELDAALKQLPERVSKRIQGEALVFGAEPIRKVMGVRAPRRPPHPDMADHIVIQRVRGQDSQEVAVAVGPARRFFYAGQQEFGNLNHPAHPFARPAFDENWQKSLELIAADLWVSLAGRGVQRSVVSDASVQSEGRLL